MHRVPQAPGTVSRWLQHLYQAGVRARTQVRWPGVRPLLCHLSPMGLHRSYHSALCLSLLTCKVGVMTAIYKGLVS